MQTADSTIVNHPNVVYNTRASNRNVADLNPDLTRSKICQGYQYLTVIAPINLLNDKNSIYRTCYSLR
jgi:hypothetical protein